MTRRDLFIGLDLGTSSLKGVVLDSTGALITSAQAAYPTARPFPGHVEQSPADWIGAAHTVLKQLSESAPATGWEAIGLTGMLPTLVTIDGAGNPGGPAITWEDTRAEAQGAELRRAVGPEELYRLTGQWVDGRYLLPVFAWLRQHQPERLSSTTLVCSAKDFLFRHLTGEVATDPSTAAGFGCFELAGGGWNADIARTAGVALSLLPPIRPATTHASMRAELARELELPEGLPVCVGAADSVLGAMGLDVMERGQVAYMAGTSTVVLGIADRIQLDPSHRYLVTPMATNGAWGLEMDLVSTGSAMQWLAETLSLAGGVPALLELAESSPPGAGGVSFLPYMGSGEQGALWDPSLRGAVFGLTLSHAKSDLARALLEGIALESRRCMRVLAEAGISPAELQVAGVGASSPMFRRLLADATGHSVAVPSLGTSVSASGAARLAAFAFGIALHRSHAREGSKRIDPDPESAALWEELAERHDRHRVMISANQ